MKTVSYTLQETERIWVISDTHFDHTNIIKYCNRPFSSVEAMNQTLIHNWIETIKPHDTVYFLGDMASGKDSKNPRWWASQLSGKIIWIKGNHDHDIHITSVIDGVEKVILSEIINIHGFEIMLIHNPFDARLDNWNSWIIHGHLHNKQPHINYAERRVNVSVEMINYKPINLASLISKIQI